LRRCEPAVDDEAREGDEDELEEDPISEIGKSFLNTCNEFNNIKFPLPDSQFHSLKLTSPDFFSTTSAAPIVAIKQPAKAWNIVIFVLESTGFNYVINHYQNEIPMPFLNKLASEGVWFENNYTGGNISPFGQFSIFTGLYPNPTPTHFEMNNGLTIPTVANWLNKNYATLFVNTSNNLYTSISLSQTFKEFYNANDINQVKPLFFNMFADETDGINFFTKKMLQQNKPFLAIYWSSAPHFPYKDYSYLTKLTPNTKLWLDRYMNDLRLVDLELQKVYDSLKQQRLLDNTIFIIVGDHGEIFGQHENLYIHGLSLYQEEIKVPLLIYAPTLLPPQIIHQVTSSIDIVPTILDILHIDYGKKLQGESLLSANNYRKYIFVYGDNDEIAAIDQQQQKMRLSFANATCFSYDLKNDPQEAQPLPCANKDQQTAILKFRNYQPKILNRYNNHVY